MFSNRPLAVIGKAKIVLVSIILLRRFVGLNVIYVNDSSLGVHNIFEIRRNHD